MQLPKPIKKLNKPKSPTSSNASMLESGNQAKPNSNLKLILLVATGLTVATGIGLGVYFGAFYNKNNNSGTATLEIRPLDSAGNLFNAQRRSLGNNNGTGHEANETREVNDASGKDKSEFKPSLYAPRSRSAFSYAFIEGFQAALLKVQYLLDPTNSTSNNTLINLENSTLYQTLTVGDFSSNPVQFDLFNTSAVAATEILNPVGSYKGINLVMDSKFKVKGYCQTSSRFIYTTKNGYKALPLAAAGDGQVPADYAFFEDAKPNKGDGSSFNLVNPTAFNSTGEEGSAAVLAVDTSYLFVCYDGTLPSFAGKGDGVLPPFDEVEAGGRNRSLYAPGRAGFALSSNIPMFYMTPTKNNDDKKKAENSKKAIGETYFISLNSTTLQSANSSTDFSKLGILTLALDANNTILGLQARGPWVPFERVAGNLTKAADGSYTFYMGRKEKGIDRVMSGVKRIMEVDVVGSFMVSDGPDCLQGEHYDEAEDADAEKLGGDNGREEEGGKVRRCMGRGVEVFMKRARRGV
ncbi:hypothetical protein HDV05_000695 [Chytridiales sp. JEL 0842]|nr:hypothetical protein HDV05_000695 [Chytridiales sp. JEL 0842]